MQQVHVLHCHVGLLSEHRASNAGLLQKQCQEIIEKGGHRIITMVPCPREADGTYSYLVITERADV